LAPTARSLAAFRTMPGAAISRSRSSSDISDQRAGSKPSKAASKSGQRRSIAAQSKPA
jgi:hypothetical protein